MFKLFLLAVILAFAAASPAPAPAPVPAPEAKPGLLAQAYTTSYIAQPAVAYNYAPALTYPVYTGYLPYYRTGAYVV